MPTSVWSYIATPGYNVFALAWNLLWWETRHGVLHLRYLHPAVQFSIALFMEDSQLWIAFLFFLPENKYIYRFAYLIFNMLELGVYWNVRSWYLFLLKGNGTLWFIQYENGCRQWAGSQSLADYLPQHWMHLSVRSTRLARQLLSNCTSLRISQTIQICVSKQN
jgi:hypothetical protein